ncbi:MAG: OmpA family protein [Candidatus Aminicenantes bacterium]|nr:MAG: OmpA family protein [Candidatus Aminicenantes bacterium]
MKKNKITFLVGTILIIGLIASTGCATKKFVLGEVATLDQKVEGVETSVEENQKRIKEHDERLVTLGSLIKEQESEMSKQRTEFDGKLSEVKKMAEGKLIFEEVLKNDEAKFQFDKWDLSDEAKVALDKFVEVLIAQDKGVYLEIQGHTDTTGEEEWNLILGKRRAEAVMEYLHKKYNIPLHRMEVISYGSDAPVGDNSTREGRAQNRRVVILVFE